MRFHTLSQKPSYFERLKILLHSLVGLPNIELFALHPRALSIRVSGEVDICKGNRENLNLDAKERREGGKIIDESKTKQNEM